MKIIFYLFLSCFIAQAVSPSLKPIIITDTQFDPKLASGGSITAVGGGDTLDLSSVSAWFYGSDEIKTCISYNEIFGVSKEEIKQEILSAIKSWQDYFKIKNINLEFENKINLNFNFVGDCKGGEHLALFFGTGPIFANLRDLRAVQKLNNPIAYVNKTHVSKDLSWSKGYIRFLETGRYSEKNNKDKFDYPDWSKKDALYKIILHEIGHVLGFVHKPETIMDESISYRLFLTDKPFQYTIDGEAQLYEKKADIKNFSLDPILNKKLMSKTFKKEVNLISLNQEKSEEISITINYKDTSKKELKSTTVINHRVNSSLYTNFQTLNNSTLRPLTAYFKINNNILSIILNDQNFIMLINGEKAAVLKEEL